MSSVTVFTAKLGQKNVLFEKLKKARMKRGKKHCKFELVKIVVTFKL